MIILKINTTERIKLFVNLILYGKINFRKLLFIFIENYCNNFSFIQIGAFDGKSHDFLFDYLTKSNLPKFGILIEPVKDYYLKLKKNYFQISGLHFENIAIHNEKTNVVIFKIKKEYEEQVPEYVIGCASIFANHFNKHLVKESYIENIQVPAMSINKLIEKYNRSKYQLLQIDTEGYDGKIILNLDLKTNKFDIIKFEHINLSLVEKKQTVSFLFRHFYIVGVDKDDMIAVKLSIFFKFVFFLK